MAISSTYRKIKLEEYIKEQLEQGVSVSAESLSTAATTLLDNMDLSVPQFDAEDHYVVSRASSSASALTSTIDTMRQDLRALYKEMIVLTSVSINSLERWSLESSVLEKRLIDLEERIDDLLLLIQDVNPQQGIIVDNFTDFNLIDKTLTDAKVDLKTTLVSLGPTNTSPTRIFLNSLNPATDVSFKVRTTVDFISRVDATESDITFPFSQEEKSWWTSIVMKSVKPVTCEYIVKLSSEPVNVSKILVNLHDSVEASPIVITPLYSTDNVSYSQLPSNTFTQEVRDVATFQFTEVSAKWIKFILIKQGPDLSSSDATTFSYQFGFKEISFFSEGFSTTTEQQLFSKPLSILDNDNLPLEFEKLTLETCERIETDTNIRYYITTSNDATVPVDSSVIWTPISPVNAASPTYPQILTVGDIDEATIEDIIPITTSGMDGSFYLISEDGSGDVQTTLETSSGVRYTLKNSNDRILNHQIKDQTYSGSGDTAIQINDKTLQLFRNVGEQGLDPTTDTVRDIQRGWKFEDPYYTSTIHITNPEGISIDVGDFPIIIDNISYTNKIDNTILTGEYGSNTGIHRIKVHKSKWKHVVPSKNTLAELKAADSLYPYNHKMLIEGYSYGSSYPDTSEKIYTGVDLFAEVLMTKVSPFDIYNNVKEDNYSVFALDKDAPGTHTDGNSKPTKVILLKVDEDDSDMLNEKFVLKFTRINQLKKYLRLRADFSTSDTKITPALYAYKIKLA